MRDNKPPWGLIIGYGLFLWAFLAHAPERERIGYYRGLCEGGGNSADHCYEIHN